MRTLALVSDAYGGRGGIALYNRNFLKALCSYPGMEEVVAVPRSITYDLEELPVNLTYLTSSAGGKLRYFLTTVRLVLFEKRVDLITCGHIHLLPFAWLLKLRHRCPVVPLIYGVEAWTPTSHWVVNRLCKGLDSFISIRKLTAHRFRLWANIENAKFFYLPNCIDENQYGVAPKRQDLLKKFGLENKKVVMTAGRMDSIEFDCRKGFDEILEVLPELRDHVPDIVYLIVGDGDDKGRLAQKAKDLSVDDIIQFSGYVSESEKADYYRLADVFAMPGSNPIFDRYPFRFVFLEALACGVPVVGCKLVDESERDDPAANALVIQVDPTDSAETIRGIRLGLSYSEKHVNPTMRGFYFPAFQSRLHDYLSQAMEGNVA